MNFTVLAIASTLVVVVVVALAVAGLAVRLGARRSSVFDAAFASRAIASHGSVPNVRHYRGLLRGRAVSASYSSRRVTLETLVASNATTRAALATGGAQLPAGLSPVGVGSTAHRICATRGWSAGATDPRWLDALLADESAVGVLVALLDSTPAGEARTVRIEPGAVGVDRLRIDAEASGSVASIAPMLDSLEALALVCERAPSPAAPLPVVPFAQVASRQSSRTALVVVGVVLLTLTVASVAIAVAVATQSSEPDPGKRPRGEGMRRDRAQSTAPPGKTK
jgi:hypothetical protein